MGAKKRYHYTKIELINQVQDLCNRLGHTPTMMDFNADSECASASAVTKYYGSWKKFLLEAGLKPNRPGKPKAHK